ncbi:MAG: PrgI family protein [Candidatus Brennerbacteria bacterium]|nr:PrgI family protein [Candidatus Brennerbacteria bacterium]
MATFQIPQFIEQQPKVVGFLTLPQFLYLATAGGISFAAFYVFTFLLWLFVSVVVVAAGIALAFIKVNGQPLPAVLRAALSYYWKPRTYVWSRALQEETLDLSQIEKIEALRRRMGIEEKLKNLALQVTTGKIFSRRGNATNPRARYQTVTYLTGEKKVARRVDYGA